MSEKRYTKSIDGSYLHNCYVGRRGDDPSKHIFYSSDKTTTVCLNGYAIIPLEEYHALRGTVMPKSEKTSIKEADEQLWGKKLKVGDVVMPDPNRPDTDKYVLRAGSELYSHAVVIQVEPLVLVSESADMRWGAFLKPEYFTVIGTAPDDVLKKCLERL